MIGSDSNVADLRKTPKRFYVDALGHSVASLAVFLRNWASFDETQREKFSSRKLRFFGLFFAIPFRYFGLVFVATTSVKVKDNCV